MPVPHQPQKVLGNSVWERADVLHLFSASLVAIGKRQIARAQLGGTARRPFSLMLAKSQPSDGTDDLSDHSDRLARRLGRVESDEAVGTMQRILRESLIYSAGVQCVSGVR
jgi:hypothetical protein